MHKSVKGKKWETQRNHKLETAVKSKRSEREIGLRQPNPAQKTPLTVRPTPKFSLSTPKNKNLNVDKAPRKVVVDKPLAMSYRIIYRKASPKAKKKLTAARKALRKYTKAARFIVRKLKRITAKYRVCLEKPLNVRKRILRIRARYPGVPTQVSRRKAREQLLFLVKRNKTKIARKVKLAPARGRIGIRRLTRRAARAFASVRKISALRHFARVRKSTAPRRFTRSVRLRRWRVYIQKNFLTSWKGKSSGTEIVRHKRTYQLGGGLNYYANFRPHPAPKKPLTAAQKKAAQEEAERAAARAKLSRLLRNRRTKRGIALRLDLAILYPTLQGALKAHAARFDAAVERVRPVRRPTIVRVAIHRNFYARPRVITPTQGFRRALKKLLAQKKVAGKVRTSKQKKSGSAKEKIYMLNRRITFPTKAVSQATTIGNKKFVNAQGVRAFSKFAKGGSFIPREKSGPFMTPVLETEKPVVTVLPVGQQKKPVAHQKNHQKKSIVTAPPVSPQKKPVVTVPPVGHQKKLAVTTPFVSPQKKIPAQTQKSAATSKLSTSKLKTAVSQAGRTSNQKILSASRNQKKTFAPGSILTKTSKRAKTVFLRLPKPRPLPSLKKWAAASRRICLKTLSNARKTTVVSWGALGKKSRLTCARPLVHPLVRLPIKVGVKYFRKARRVLRAGLWTHGKKKRTTRRKDTKKEKQNALKTFTKRIKSVTDTRNARKKLKYLRNLRKLYNITVWKTRKLRRLRTSARNKARTVNKLLRLRTLARQRLPRKHSYQYANVYKYLRQQNRGKNSVRRVLTRRHGRLVNVARSPYMRRGRYKVYYVLRPRGKRRSRARLMRALRVGVVRVRRFAAYMKRRRALELRKTRITKQNAVRKLEGKPLLLVAYRRTKAAPVRQSKKRARRRYWTQKKFRALVRHKQIYPRQGKSVNKANKRLYFARATRRKQVKVKNHPRWKMRNWGALWDYRGYEEFDFHPNYTTPENSKRVKVKTADSVVRRFVYDDVPLKDFSLTSKEAVFFHHRFVQNTYPRHLKSFKRRLQKIRTPKNMGLRTKKLTNPWRFEQLEKNYIDSVEERQDNRRWEARAFFKFPHAEVSPKPYNSNITRWGPGQGDVTKNLSLRKGFYPPYMKKTVTGSNYRALVEAHKRLKHLIAARVKKAAGKHGFLLRHIRRAEKTGRTLMYNRDRCVIAKPKKDGKPNERWIVFRKIHQTWWNLFDEKDLYKRLIKTTTLKRTRSALFRVAHLSTTTVGMRSEILDSRKSSRRAQKAAYLHAVHAQLRERSYAGFQRLRRKLSKLPSKANARVLRSVLVKGNRKRTHLASVSSDAFYHSARGQKVNACIRIKADAILSRVIPPKNRTLRPNTLPYIALHPRFSPKIVSSVNPAGLRNSLWHPLGGETPVSRLMQSARPQYTSKLAAKLLRSSLRTASPVVWKANTKRLRNRKDIIASKKAKRRTTNKKDIKNNKSKKNQRGKKRWQRRKIFNRGQLARLEVDGRLNSGYPGKVSRAQTQALIWKTYKNRNTQVHHLKTKQRVIPVTFLPRNKLLRSEDPAVSAMYRLSTHENILFPTRSQRRRSQSKKARASAYGARLRYFQQLYTADLVRLPTNRRLISGMHSEKPQVDLPGFAQPSTASLGNLISTVESEHVRRTNHKKCRRRGILKRARRRVRKAFTLDSKLSSLRFSLATPRMTETSTTYTARVLPLLQPRIKRSWIKEEESENLSTPSPLASTFHRLQGAAEKGRSALNLRAQRLRLLRWRRLQWTMPVRLPRTTVSELLRLSDSKTTKGHLPRKLAATTQGKRNTRLPLPIIWSPRHTSRKFLSEISPAESRLFRTFGLKKRFAPLRLARKQFAYIDRLKMNREGRKLIRFRKKDIPTNATAQKYALEELEGLRGQFSENRGSLALKMLTKLDHAAAARLQEKLKNRNLLVDQRFARRVITTRASRERREARRVLTLGASYAPRVTRFTPAAQIVSLRAASDKVAFDTKLAALRYQRSARRMSKLDHQIAGYSYRFALKARRMSSPRFEGIPLPRKWPSHKELRNRALQAETLEHKGLPQITYPDLRGANLQYLRGSADSVGIERFRRVYRVKSPTNRWWKVVNFENPFGSLLLRMGLPARKTAIPGLHRPNQTGIRTRFQTQSQPWRPRRQARPVRLPLAADNLTIDATYANARTWGGNRWQELNVARESSLKLFTHAEIETLHPQLWDAVTQGLTASSTDKLKAAIYKRYLTWRAKQHIPPFVAANMKITWMKQETAHFFAYQLNKLLHGASAPINAELESYALSHQHRARLLKNKDYLWGAEILPKFQVELTGKTRDMRDKGNDALYSRWLLGLEGHVKQAQNGRFPPKRGIYARQKLLSLGRRRTRFPASGLRKFTHDRAIHAYARRVASARFRRAGRSKFIHARPRPSRNRKIKLSTYEMGRKLRFRRHNARLQSLLAYPTKAWRELLVYRARQFTPTPIIPVSSDVTIGDKDTALEGVSTNQLYPADYAHPRSTGVRRRFAPLPLQLKYRMLRKLERERQPRRLQTMRTFKIGLLRAAIRRRRRERRFVDLRKSIHHRSLSRDYVQRPWMVRKRRRARARANRGGKISIKSIRRKSSKNLYWGVDLASSVGSPLAKYKRRGPRDTTDFYVKNLRITPRWNKVVDKLTVFPKRPRRLTGWGKKPVYRKNPSIADADEKITEKQSDEMVTGYNGTLYARVPCETVDGYPYLRRVTIHKGDNRKRKLRASIRARLRRDRARQHIFRVPNRGLDSIRFSREKARRTQVAAHYRAGTLPVLRRKLAGKYVSRLRQVSKKMNRKQKSAYGGSYAVHNMLENKAIVSAELRRTKSAHVNNWGARFVAQVTRRTPVAPFIFQKALRIVIKSKETIRRERRIHIALNAVRYRRTAQYVEGVTRLIPELISRMIHSRKGKKIQSAAELKHLVAAIYWSLRVYLNVDPKQGKLNIRDVSREELQALWSEMRARERTRSLGREQRALLRRRFQPAAINPAPRSSRFKQDWLRAFFPRKHGLFLEDMDEYAKLPVPTKRVLRVVIHRRPSKWTTAPHTRTLEQRGHKLLTLRYSRSARRAETVLKTIPRVPAVYSYIVAANTADNMVGAEAPQESFFARSFSTQAPLVLRHIRRERRFKRCRHQLSHYINVKTRIRLKVRTEALGRSGFIEDAKSTLGGKLDPRALRLKSPRNRQYVLRLSGQKHTNLEGPLKNLMRIQALQSSRIQELKAGGHATLIRTTRLATYRSLVKKVPRNPLEKTLARMRAVLPQRRAPIYLIERQKLMTANMPLDRRHSVLSGWDDSTKGRLAQFEKTAALRSLPTPVHRTDALRARVTKDNYVVESHRSILQYRHAAQRSPRMLCKKLPVARVLALTKQYAHPAHGRGPLVERATAFSNKYKVWHDSASGRTKRGCRILQKRARLLLRNQPSFRERRTVTLRRIKLPFPRTTYKAETGAASLVNATKKRFEVRFVPVPSLKFAIEGYTKHLVSTAHFRTLKGKTFDKQRTVVWNYLTLRRNKRDRTVRDWLKRTKRWLNSKWTPKMPRDGRWPRPKPSADWMPRTVWLEIQRRMRKLEWRESNQHFYRAGFRQAFSFSPQERRRAPWLEPLIYRRAAYSTRRGEYRRYQFPREQKRLNWMQRVRKSLFPARRNRSTYIHGRRWPRLRMYNQRMFRGLFDLRNKSAARRHFRKLRRQRPHHSRRSGFAKSLKGLGNRLDNVLMQLHITPTVFWSREIAPMGLLRCSDGVVLRDPAQRIAPGTKFKLEHAKIDHFRHFFEPVIRKHNTRLRLTRKVLPFRYPKNFHYCATSGNLTYLGLPEEKDLRHNGRLNGRLFRWFALDSVRH